ncbi:MAG: hypothetical protein ACLGH3_06260 [Actinomycetota bacterium]
MRRSAILVVSALALSLLPSTIANAVELNCPPPDAPLAASRMPTNPGVPELYRTGPDGFTTVTALIDDPADSNPVVSFETTVLLPQPLPAGTKAGTWYHQWEQAPEIITVGVWMTNSRGDKVRLPVLAIENFGSSIDELTLQAQARALNDALHHAFITAPFLWNALLVGSDGVAYIPQVGGLAAGLGFIIASYTLTNYPASIGWESYPPIYIWQTYENSLGQQLWTGQSVRRSGAYSYQGASSTSGGYGGKGCTRTRIDEVIRTADSATAPAGVWISEIAEGRCDGSCMAPSTTERTEEFNAKQTITSGIQIGGADVPLVVVEQTGYKRGEQPFLMYADYQRERVSVGTEVAGRFVPLIGFQAEAWHAAPPNRQRRLLSVGAYDPLGTYRPVIGTRMWFERLTSDVWPFLLALDGLGSHFIGDAMIDLGTFDPDGGFVPLIGTRYDDDFPGRRFEYRAMISTGPYVLDDFQPVLAATYDGKQTLTRWALADVSNDRAAMQEWIIAAGGWNPSPPIGYRPIVGVRFAPGTDPGQHETYRVGAFPADYQTFVPLAGVDYHGSQTSASWALGYAGDPSTYGTMRIVTPARFDVGIETPVTGFVPVAGARMTPGSPQRTDAGVWTPVGYLPLVTVCQSPTTSPGGGSIGLALGGSGAPFEIPLARGSVTPTAPPPTVTTGVC